MRIEICSSMQNTDVLAKAFGGVLTGEKQNVTAITTDTRELRDGDVFLALRGRNRDGHDYLVQAFDKGAVCVITEKAVNTAQRSGAQILVADTQKALLAAAGFWRKQWRGMVIAVAGSVGKTTCKEALACILRHIGSVEYTKGNFNSRIGMPLSVLSMEKADFHILEIGISEEGEMEEMAKALLADLTVLTNVGRAHIGNFPSFDALVAQKLKICENGNESARFLLPEFLKLPPGRYEKNRYFYFGAQGFCNFCAARAFLLKGRQFLEVRARGKAPLLLSCGMPGQIGISFLNILGGVAFLLDIPADVVQNGINEAEKNAPRMKRKSLGHRLLIDDTYNASPEAMVGALEMLRLLGENRETVAVLGDMLELGAQSAMLHREIGKSVAKNAITFLYTFGENAREIASGAKAAGMAPERISCFGKGESRELAFDLASNTATDAVLLFKASHGMRMGEVLEKFEEVVG